MNMRIRRMCARMLALLMLCGVMSLCACGGGDSQPTYVFKAGDVTLWVGQTAEGVVDKLATTGAPKESPSCNGVAGSDFLYTCAGFRVYTEPSAKGGHVINKIELTDDSVSTPEGVTVGSTYDEVITAMAGHTPEDGANSSGDSSLIYKDDGMRLQFILRNGAVTNIQYIAQ